MLAQRMADRFAIVRMRQAWMPISLIGPVLAVSLFLLVTRQLPADEFEVPADVASFLKQHCSSCHTGTESEADLNLATLSTKLGDRQIRGRWVTLYDRIDRGEMPPAGAVPQPDAATRTNVLQALRAALTQADRLDREVVLRRLNRNEYALTVRDLFGIHVDVDDILPDDSVEQGFDTVGASLSLSTEQLVSYLEAADAVLDEVFGPSKAPRRIHETVNAKDLRSKTTADKVLKDGVLLFSGAKSLPLYGLSVPGPGLYRLRFQVRAVQTQEPVILRVDGGVTGRVAAHVAGFFEVSPGDNTTIELTDRAVESSDTFAFALVGGFPWWSVDADNYSGPGLFLGEVTVEGPLEEWPRESRQKLLSGIDPAAGTLDDVRRILSRVIPRAFRRPIDSGEIEPYAALANQALQQGLPFEKALRRSLKGVLCAPEFLFMEERLDGASDGRQVPAIDQHALAVRLSYFLWSSLPDDELVRLAEAGQLQQESVLRGQVERMLRDPRAKRFIRNFTDQWLRLRDIDFTVPNQRLYPEYDQLLRYSMLEETRAFFREVLTRDLSVRTFVDSDFAMLNQPLAKFYGIEKVRGLEFRRVTLPEHSRRGGVMTHASVLKVSADGTRTSPVLRGAWIHRNLFGTPLPPPPPTAGAIEPDIRGATTIREQLARHREDASCSRCHAQLDPPGFALESFDVIGGERDWYRTTDAGQYLRIPLHPQAPKHFVRYRRGPDVDPSGMLPDERRFSGIQEYKRLLLEDHDVLARPLTRLLMTYALGRNLGFADRTEIEQIVSRSKAGDYGLRTILLEVVCSPAFLTP